MKIKRYKNYITWQNKKGEFNTECNRASLPDDLSLTIPTNALTKVAVARERESMRIRKLVPIECLKLMGFTKSDYNALVEIGLTDSQIFHIAGDSIITTCLVSLLNPFVNERNKHIEIVENYVEKEVIESGNK